MKRFFRVVVLLWVVLIAVIGVTVVVARQQPLHPALAVLHLNMCEPPCWIGITPGVTTVDEAIKQLEHIYSPLHYQNERYFIDDTLISKFFRNHELIIDVEIHISDKTVDYIWFGLTEQLKHLSYPPTYADIHRLFGIPSDLHIQTLRGENMLFYDSATIFVKGEVAGKRHPLKERVVMYFVFAQHNPNLPKYGYVKWRGFLPIERYIHTFCIEQGCD